MTYKDIMQELKELGTAQNRKVYARHGVGKKMYGVSFANLTKLKKKIKVDQGLALRLWSSGNHDARVLATMVADPEEAKHPLLEAWSKDLDNYVITDAFAGLAIRTPLARRKMETWTKSKQEWLGRSGWQLVAGVAMADNELPDKYFEAYLDKIEKTIHQQKNYTRHSMNMALIAIGMRNSRLEGRAIAAAKRIGKVEVDHGATSCKTPDAIAYIEKAKSRKRKTK